MIGDRYLDDEEDDRKGLPHLSEEEKVAMLGRPKLGETTRSQIRIKESKEFKVRPDLFMCVLLASSSAKRSQNFYLYMGQHQLFHIVYCYSNYLSN